MQGMVRSLIVALWPDGGQGTARRNAWSAMVEDNKRARERQAVEACVRAATAAQHTVVVNI